MKTTKTHTTDNESKETTMKTFEAILSTTGRVAVSMFIEASTAEEARSLANDLTGNEPIAIRSLDEPEFVAEI